MPSWLIDVPLVKPLSTQYGGWIDSGWKEVKLVWNPVKSNGEGFYGGNATDISDQDVCIHFSHDNWKADQMQIINLNQGWQVFRMLPPGKHFYFFSFSSEEITKAAVDHKKIVPRGECLHAKGLLPHSVQFLNCIEISPRKEPFELKNERPRRPWYGGKIEAPTIWTLETSIFKERVNEVESRSFQDAGVLDAAFENDWHCIYPKLEKFLKVQNERNELKLVCAKFFPTLRACFRYYAAEGGGTEPFSITFNDFGDFCQDTEIVDDKKCSLSAIDTIFIATNFEVEKNDDNPDHALERPEFLEAVTRLAIAKFSHLDVTPAEALEALMNQHIIPRADRHDCDVFRTASLYLETTDGIFRSFEQDLRSVLNQYGKQRRRLDGKRKPHLSFENFLKILQDGNLIDGKLSLEKAKFCFVNSKFTSVNESTNNEAHKFLSFVDFLEALLWVNWLRNNGKGESTNDRTQVDMDDLECMLLGMLDSIRTNNKALRQKIKAKTAKAKMKLKAFALAKGQAQMGDNSLLSGDTDTATGASH